MKNIFYSLFSLIIFQGIAQNTTQQTEIFADKNYYLVDSLILEELSVPDRKLIDSCFNVFHQSKNDIEKVRTLDRICENLINPVWQKYQFLQFNIIKQNLRLKMPLEEKKEFIKYFASALNNIGNIYAENGDYRTAIKYNNLTFKAREWLGYKKDMAESLSSLGFLYLQQGETKKSLTTFNKSELLYTEIGDLYGLAKIMNNIAYIYGKEGKIEDAILYFHKSLTLYEKVNNLKGIAETYNNIGSIYLYQNDEIKALDYFYKAIPIFEKIGDQKNLATTLNNIGVIYKDQQNPKKSLDIFIKCLVIQNKLNDKKGIARSLNNVGYEYFVMKEYVKALENYELSNIKYTELGDNEGIGLSFNNISNLYLSQYKENLDVNFLIKSKEYALKGYQIAKDMGYVSHIKDAAITLSKIYEKEKNGMESLKMYKEYILMRDSVISKEAIKSTSQQQAKYEYEKQKAIDDAQHEKLMAIEKEAKAKQKVITYAIAGGLGLVAIFLFFVFNRLQVTRKQKTIIEQKEKETHKQKEIIEEKHREITDSISYAERIQRSFLATKEMLDENLFSPFGGGAEGGGGYFVFFRPKDVVSGDFYWAAELNNGNFAFSVADSTGHGVPGAIMSILNISSLEKSIEKETEPNQILNQTRKIIIDRLKKDGSPDGGKDGMDCSLLVINQERTQLSFAAANNPVFIVRSVRHSVLDTESDNEIAGQARNDDGEKKVVRNDGYELIEFKPDKMPVGKHDNDTASFTLHTALLQKDDVIYALTDGFPDQFGGEKGKKYMIKNLKELLLQIAHLPMLEQEQKLAEEFDNWKGSNEQVDDVCIIGVRV